MKISKKYIALLLAVIVLAGVIWCVKSYSSSWRSQTFEQNSQWSTYADAAYGFSLKYPTGWTVNNQSYTSQGKASIVVQVSSPVHKNLLASTDAIFMAEIGIDASGAKNHYGEMFFKTPFLHADGGPVPVQISNDHLKNSDEYKQFIQIFNSLEKNK